MKKFNKTFAVALVGIISLVGASSVSAKSYEYIINYGTNQYVSFTKYECDDQTHSALSAYDLYGTKAISITTTVHKGSKVSGKKLDSHNHIYQSGSMFDEWNWKKTSNRELTIKSVNETNNSKLRGRLYINNGKKA